MSNAEIGSYFHLTPQMVEIINNTCLICGHHREEHGPDYCLLCECEPVHRGSSNSEARKRKEGR